MQETTTAQPPPGPTLDPPTDATQDKFILGGIALVLAVIVVWGRRVRKARRK